MDEERGGVPWSKQGRHGIDWEGRDPDNYLLECAGNPITGIVGELKVGGLVRVPSNVYGIGNKILRILEKKRGCCPMCLKTGQERYGEVCCLEGTGWRFLGCETCGWVWFNR